MNLDHITTRLKARWEENDLTSFVTAHRLLQGVAVGIALLYLLPLESGIMTAFKTQNGYLTSLPFAPPREISLDPWYAAWDVLSHEFANSLAFSIPATILSAVIGSLAAHGLTNTEWRGQVAVFVLFVAGTFIPIQSVLIPVSRFWAILGLESILQTMTPFDLYGLSFVQRYYVTIVELILTHTAFGIPITTLLFRGFYKELSKEQLEAARLDGAGMIAIYRHIILPLSKPIFVVTFIYQFTSIWNGLLLSLIVAGAGPAAPITLELNKLAIAGFVPTYNTMMAGAFITAFPTLLIYVFFGDRFVRGIAGYGGSGVTN